MSTGGAAAARIAAEKYRLDTFLQSHRVPPKLARRVRAHALAALHRDLEREERDFVEGAGAPFHHARPAWFHRHPGSLRCSLHAPRIF